MVVAGLRETRRPASATQGLRQFLRSLPDIGDIAEGQHFCGRPQRGQGASRFRVDARCTASVACLERMAERGDAVPVCLLLQCLQYLGTLELSAVGGDALLWMVSPVLEAARRQILQDHAERRTLEAEAGTFRQKVEKMAMEVEDHHSWRERSEERLTNLLGRHERQLEAFQSEAQALKGQRREVEATRRQLDVKALEMEQRWKKELEQLKDGHEQLFAQLESLEEEIAHLEEPQKAAAEQQRLLAQQLEQMQPELLKKEMLKETNMRLELEIKDLQREIEQLEKRKKRGLPRRTGSKRP